MIEALMRRLMSLDTSVTRASGNSFCRASVWPRMALSAPWPGRLSGKPPLNTLVWKNSRPATCFFVPLMYFPLGSTRPASMLDLSVSAISSSRKRLTCRTLRAASDKPFLPASSSSSTTIGMYTSCSSKRKIAVGSCISTFVSSTKMRRCVRSREARARLGSGALPLGISVAADGESKESEESFTCLQFGHCGEHFVGVPGYLYLAPFAPQDAPLVDEERAAFDAHVLAPVHALFLVHVDQLADAEILVREQVEREAHLRLELLVRRHAGRRHAENDRTGLLEGRIQVAKCNAFLGATGRVVARIEVQHELLAGRIAQLPALAAGHGTGEGRHLLIERHGAFRHGG